MTDADHETPPDIICPHCSGALYGDYVAKLKDKSRMSFSITPQAGELLTARHAGGVIEQMDKFLTALGKNIGVKTVVAVEKINTSESGTITVDLIVTRLKRALTSANSPERESR